MLSEGRKQQRVRGLERVRANLLFLFCTAASASFCQSLLSQPGQVELHNRQAQEYLREEEPALAIGEFQQILLLDPNNVAARGNLGVLLFFSGRCDEAAPQLRAALNMQSEVWRIQALVGVCELKIGSVNNGRNDLEGAFPHLDQDKIKALAGRELIALYSSTGELGKIESIRKELASSGSVPNAPSVQRENYVGDRVCLPCHQQISDSYLHTSHHLTSQPAARGSLSGSFLQGSNVLTIHQALPGDPRPALTFVMGQKGDAYYETAIMGTAPHAETESERMDLVIGSGVRGQSYLHWEGDALYELPVSFWSAGRRWINSPGYTDGTADFSRAVHPRCLECHVSYIKPLSEDPEINRYDRKSLQTGISCETCHGPTSEHVAGMQTASGVSSGSRGTSIINPGTLSRDRQVDLCALCHNGIRGKPMTTAFSYLPGEPLGNYVAPDPADPAEHPDVHGDQVGLLKRSKCYLQSSKLTCSTCHDIHAPERTAASYSTHCLACHQWQSCGVSKKMGPAIASNCIDCHMPVEPTALIISETAGKQTRASMRNHWIKVYSQ